MKRVLTLIGLSLILVKCLISQISWIGLNSNSDFKFNQLNKVSSSVFVVGDNGANGIILKSTDSGNNWQKLIPSYDQGLEGIFFPSISVGYTVGWHGTILKTTDSGLSWISVGNSLITTEPLYSLYFFDNNLGFCAGGNGTILKTSNGGLTWESISITYQEIRKITFINQSTGFAVTKGRPAKIFKTTNQGNTWDDIFTESGNSEFFDLFFSNTANGFICGGKDSEGAVLLQTSDGGSSWVKKSVPFFEWLKSIYFDEYGKGICVGTNGMVLTSNDGGINWTSQKLALGILNSSIIFNQNPYICGESGKILRGSFGSPPSSTIIIYSPQTLNNLTPGENKIIRWKSIGVNNLKIEFSSNSGQNWSSLANSVSGLDSTFVWSVPNISSSECLIKISDNLNANISSTSGLFKITPTNVLTKIKITIPQIFSNRGDTVLLDIRIKCPTGVNFSSSQIEFSGISNFIYAGLDYSNTLVESHNWTYNGNLSSGILYTGGAGSNDISGEGIFFRIKIIVPQSASGYIPIEINSAIFNTGNLFVHIENGGITVTTRNTGDVDLNSKIQTYDASQILKFQVGTVSLSPQQLINADVNMDGIVNSFDAALIIKYCLKMIGTLPNQTISNFDGSISMLNSILASNNEIIEVPVMLNTVNNTSSFEGCLLFDNERLIFQNLLWSSQLQSFTKELIVENNNIKFASASSQNQNLNGTLLTLRFVKKNNFNFDNSKVSLEYFRINAGQNLYKIASTSIVAPTSMDEETIKYSYNLYQNFPNPFNPSTKIKFQIPEKQNVKLEVYDLLGNIIEVLIDNEISPGEYSVNFSGNKSRLSSGLYFYKLTAGSYIATKSMIYLK